jgi:uncharacterized integral membrane protein
MRWKLIILLVLSLLLVIFAVQNYEIVSIQFLFWSFQTSRTIILFGTFIIGVLVGLMATINPALQMSLICPVDRLKK